jgi:hypothetical protein
VVDFTGVFLMISTKSLAISIGCEYAKPASCCIRAAQRIIELCKIESGKKLEDEVTHVLSEWFNDYAPLGEEDFRKGARKFIKMASPTFFRLPLVTVTTSIGRYKITASQEFFIHKRVRVYSNNFLWNITHRDNGKDHIVHQGLLSGYKGKVSVKDLREKLKVYINDKYGGSK